HRLLSFKTPATTPLYTLSLHDALPISAELFTFHGKNKQPLRGGSYGNETVIGNPQVRISIHYITGSERRTPCDIRIGTRSWSREGNRRAGFRVQRRHE